MKQRFLVKYLFYVVKIVYFSKVYDNCLRYIAVVSTRTYIHTYAQILQWMRRTHFSKYAYLLRWVRTLKFV